MPSSTMCRASVLFVPFSDNEAAAVLLIGLLTRPPWPDPSPRPPRLAGLAFQQRLGERDVYDCNRRQGRRRRRDAARVLAADAVPAGGLPDLLHRPRQRRIRFVADEQGRRHRSENLWP